MKNNIWISKSVLCTLLLLGTLTACNDKLDIKPEQFIEADQALSSPENIELVLEGAYAQLGAGFTGLNAELGGLYATNLLLMPDLQASEGYLFWQGTFNQYRDVSQKAMLADNTIAQVTWRRAYKAINSVNGVLSALNIVKEEDRDRTEGEAKFIRGILYFELVRMFAQPWVAGAANEGLGVPLVLSPTFTITEESKVSRATIAQVYAQVLDDLTTAKNLLPEENGVRASTFTASGFLSRVYLQQSDYQKALVEANRVIESDLYRLLPSVKTVFETNNTEEAIFEIQQNTQNNAGTSNDGLATFYSSGGPGNGRADVRVEEEFYNLYPAQDKRKQELFYIGAGRRPGSLRSSKWFDPFKNVPVMRIAEMYLTRAEANARLGTAVGDTPVNDLNTIRNRAGLPDVATATVADILQERQLELAYEGVRIHDIKRTQGSTGDFQYNSPKLVFPIPQREINANKNLVQNQGY
jgi:tetratricopeptide (TPR) repeat protein